jgi:hypothetical protein
METSVEVARADIPSVVTASGADATKRFFEFFTVPIRKRHTHEAHYRAVLEFLALV